MISVEDYGKKFIVTDNILKEKKEIKKFTGVYDVEDIKDFYNLSLMHETKTETERLARRISLLRTGLFFNSCKLGDFESCKMCINDIVGDVVESVFMYGRLMIRHNGENDTLNSFLNYELNKRG